MKNTNSILSLINNPKFNEAVKELFAPEMAKRIGFELAAFADEEGFKVDLDEVTDCVERIVKSTDYLEGYYEECVKKFGHDPERHVYQILIGDIVVCAPILDYCNGKETLEEAVSDCLLSMIETAIEFDD